MKGCFLLQRGFAYIGHDVALWLKEKYSITDFCGYVQYRPSYDFLVSQKEIKYSTLLLDEDIHKEYKNEKLNWNFLKNLEKEYGLPNLWPYLTIDRIIMSNQLVREYPYDKPPYAHEEMLRILQVKAKKIIEFLDREKPDFVFFSVVGSVGSMLLFHIAKAKGIKTVFLHPARIRNRYFLSDGYTRWPDIAEKTKNYISNNFYSETAIKFLQNFKDSPLPYSEQTTPQKKQVSRNSQFKFLLPRNLWRTARLFLGYVKNHFERMDRHDYDYIGPWNYLKDAAKRKVRNIIGVEDLYDTIDPNENYVFFPLHVEPEITLLLFAPFFTNQLHLIKQIAMSLPVGFKLYVKEHPSMVQFRPRSFYRHLKKIPNVRLINPAITGFELIKNAKLITAITGSVGWEATLMEKPVICFGHVFYNLLSFVKNCKTPEDIPFLVKEQLENFQYNREELLAFITALFEESTEIDLERLWDREPDLEKKKIGVKPIADLLAKKLGLNETN